jgi:hypothetical protein
MLNNFLTVQVNLVYILINTMKRLLKQIRLKIELVISHYRFRSMYAKSPYHRINRKVKINQSEENSNVSKS